MATDMAADTKQLIAAMLKSHDAAAYRSGAMGILRWLRTQAEGDRDKNVWVYPDDSKPDERLSLEDTAAVFAAWETALTQKGNPTTA